MHLLWRQGPSQTLVLTVPHRLASQQTPGSFCFCPLSAKIIVCTTVPRVLCACWGFELRSLCLPDRCSVNQTTSLGLNGFLFHSGQLAETGGLASGIQTVLLLRPLSLACWWLPHSSVPGCPFICLYLTYIFLLEDPSGFRVEPLGPD